MRKNTVDIPSECLVSGTLNGDETHVPTPTEGEQLIAIVQKALTTADELGKGTLITIASYDFMQKINAKIVLTGDYYDAERINDVMNQLTKGGEILLLDGTINLYQPLHLKSNIILEGSGDSTVFKGREEIDAIENTELLFNVILREFLIDGNKVDNSYTNCGNALHLFMTLSTVERGKTKNIKKSALLLNWDSNVADSMCYLNKYVIVVLKIARMRVLSGVGEPRILGFVTITSVLRNQIYVLRVALADL